MADAARLNLEHPNRGRVGLPAVVGSGRLGAVSRATAVSADARRANAAVVFEYLNDHVPCSRKDIREATGLVSGTVTTIVAELIARGLVRETGQLAATGGRPQRLLEPVAERVVGAIARVRKETVDVELVDAAGRSLWFRQEPHGAAHGDTADLTRTLASALDDAYTAAVSRPSAWYAGAVVAVPGLVADERTLLITLEMPLRDVPLVADLKSLLSAPQSIQLLNSGRTAALAEWAAVPCAERPALMAYVEAQAHGVSGGLVQGGRLVGGEHGLAGEVGHIVVESDGEPCDCGARGCLATVLAIDRLLVASGVSDSEIADLGERGGERLRELLEAGDDGALAAIARAARGLAAAVGTLSNLTDVGMVVVGGQLAVLGTWLLEPVRALIRARARVQPVFNPVLRIGGGLESAVRAGMVQVLRGRLTADPLAVPEFMVDDGGAAAR